MRIAVLAALIAGCEEKEGGDGGGGTSGGGSSGGGYWSLSVSVTGAGTVASPTTSDSCQSACQWALPAGSGITVTATPASGWRFTGWGPGGACAGSTSSISVPASSGTTCLATFIPVDAVGLTVTASGPGRVTGPGIDCGAGGVTCTATRARGEVVTLSAYPDTGHGVGSWTGCAPSTSGTSCTVTVDTDRTVGVSFVPAVDLVVLVSPAGKALVQSPDRRIECDITCRSTFPTGATVTLTALPVFDWHVDHWTGCTSSSGNDCSVTMAGPATVTAVLAPDLHSTVYAGTGGRGTGKVTGPGIDCGAGGSTCVTDPGYGNGITLTAVASPGSYFDRWDGDCVGLRGSVYLVPTTDLRCGALFGLGAGPMRSTLTAGDGHTCTVKPEGTVRCWGANGSGQLGDGSTTPSLAPVTVSGIAANGPRSAVALAAGSAHTCALLSDQSVVCWGSNHTGQLGDGSPSSSTYVPAPVAVAGLGKAISIGAGPQHACAVLDDTSVKCWGYNSDGQLGNGATNASGERSPVQVLTSGSRPFAGVLGVGGSMYTTCGLYLQGSVTCWGAGGSGEIGNGDTQPSLIASSQVAGLLDGFAVAAGGFGPGTACAIGTGLLAGTAAGAGGCWGAGGSGQLGNGTTSTSAVYAAVTGLSGATGITLGSEHACARLSGGAVRCWGKGTGGELGDGLVQDSSVPASVQGLTSALEVASGPAARHTCATVTGGAVWCWGRGDAGQLGDGGSGALHQSGVPVQVTGL